jgi:hypothetical protein
MAPNVCALCRRPVRRELLSRNQARLSSGSTHFEGRDEDVETGLVRVQCHACCVPCRAQTPAACTMTMATDAESQHACRWLVSQGAQPWVTPTEGLLRAVPGLDGQLAHERLGGRLPDALAHAVCDLRMRTCAARQLSAPHGLLASAAPEETDSASKSVCCGTAPASLAAANTQLPTCKCGHPSDGYSRQVTTTRPCNPAPWRR